MATKQEKPKHSKEQDGEALGGETPKPKKTEETEQAPPPQGTNFHDAETVHNVSMR